MATKIQMPDLAHDWRWKSVFGGEPCWLCLTCGGWSYSSHNESCEVKVSAWGHQMRVAGAAVERDKIVRYLIDRAEDVRATPACYDFTNQLATEIESLEHNKED